MDTQFSYREGMTVYGSEGDKVGKIVSVDPSYVVVEKGFFFPTDYYIPTSAIASVDNDNVYLTVSKDEATNQGWDQPLTTGTATTGYETDYQTTTTTTTDYDTSVDRGQTRATDLNTDDELRVKVYEEELSAGTRERESGKVRIEKDVLTEERTIDVPVTEERVRVHFEAGDGQVAGDEATFEEGVIDVPLRREEVVLEKQARQTGEVVIDKEQVQRTERVSGTVRREEVRVDDSAVTSDSTITDRTR